MKKNIAILTGGDSEERVISLRSAAVVQANLPTDRYNSYLIDIQGTDWRELQSGTQIDKNDFSLTLNGERIRFDCAFAALHGSPLEDGKMQGYLDMQGLPYTCCNGYVSALTMSKAHTKSQLAAYGIPMAKSVLLRQGEPVDMAALAELAFPLFVKPDDHGSSFGVTKVKEESELLPAIEEAFRFSRRVMVEAFMPGREFSNGVLRVNGEVVVLPITEIIPKREFFDYEAKYEGASEEVTPARLPEHLTRQCQARTKAIYEWLDCSGVIRIDYILVGDIFYLLEPNSIPGLSPASMIPQQAVAHGWPLDVFFPSLVEEAIRAAKP
jgi:D-alanine-D-alanine ligase